MMNLRAMQRADARSMMSLRSRDCKEASWIREKTTDKDILETVHQLKWSRVGHTSIRERMIVGRER